APQALGTRAAELSIAGFKLQLSGEGVAAPPLQPEISLYCTTFLGASGGTATIDAVVGASTEVTCSISNLGAGTLTLGPAPVLTLSGTDAAEFSIDSTGLGTNISNGGSTSFKLTFAPSSVGAKS